MSKAFIKENDDDFNDDFEEENQSSSFIGKNYITPKGLEKLKTELHHLLHKERPSVVQTVSWAASNGDRSENGDYIYGKRRLREIDRRIRFLTKRIESAVLVDPEKQSGNKILFGATVTVLHEDGSQKTYSIVGVDESNPNLGLISWVSPLAKALLGQSLGDVISFKNPKGEEEIEIIKVEYKSIQF
jgi:transcription elongation factor GreB